MTVALAEDHDILIATARDYARRELLPRDRQWDAGKGCVADVLPGLSEMGFTNFCIAPEFGGLGCGYETSSRILHEIAYASPATAVSLSVHNMVGRILAAHAVEPKRQRWLETWGSPRSFAAFAITEAEAGSDPSATRTKAVRTSSGWKISGEKTWISNGLSGSWFLTLARTGPESDGKRFTAFLVPGDAPGLNRAPIHGKMGIRGSETAVISYDEVQCSDEHRIGPEGKGMRVFMSGLNGGRVGIASQATGIAEACLDEMITYARERKQFGRPIGSFQAIQAMISDSAMELAAAKELIRRAARLLDAGKTDPAASAKAKLFASEAANRIAYRAIQVHGGYGYVQEYRVEQLYRDARVTTIYEGTSEIQRLVIARALLGQ